ncbi:MULTISPECIES: helix-turn-helix domain-containing protein [Haloarcula]|uniref:helix-turn-helix domain-containing protein n=1 Tax=Haloarcula TaxID=2237 RepID=UPI0023ED3BBC|nr:helix-turn-helix domain-containing protein [Halomicroarcula sp. XH51]
MPGVRAELAFDDPTGCPVADLTDGQGGTARSVTWSDGDRTVTEQFEYDGDVDASSGSETAPEGDVNRVFDYDDAAVYELERESEDCVCQTIAEFDCPLSDVDVADGTLYVSLHLRDATELRALLERLRGAYDDVRVRYLVQSGDGDSSGDVVPVDRDRLTDRQREAVATAYRMGYFDYPRQSNASEVAEALDIAPSTFTEHLTAAQSELLRAVLDDDSPGPR